MLLVFAAPAAADNVIYFDPDPSCAAPGEEINVTLYVDTTEGSASMDTRVYTDMDVVEIIDGQPGDYSLMWYFVPHADHIRIGGWSWDGLNLDSRNLRASILHSEGKQYRNKRYMALLLPFRQPVWDGTPKSGMEQWGVWLSVPGTVQHQRLHL